MTLMIEYDFRAIQKSVVWSTLSQQEQAAVVSKTKHEKFHGALTREALLEWAGAQWEKFAHSKQKASLVPDGVRLPKESSSKKAGSPAKAIADEARDLLRSSHGADPEAMRKMLDILADRVGRLSHDDIVRFAAVLWTNNGEWFPAEVRNRLLTFVGVPQPKLSALAIRLERNNHPISEKGAKQLLAAAKPLRGRDSHTLLRLLDVCDFSPKARALIEAKTRDVDPVDLLKTACAKNALDEGTWLKDVLPWASRSRYGLSPTADAVLDVYFDDKVEKSAAVKASMKTFLENRGYPLDRYPGATTPATIRTRHIEAPDAAFARLAERAGRTDTKLVLGVLDAEFDERQPVVASHMWVNPGEIPGNGIDDDKDGWVDDVHGISNAVPGQGDIQSLYDHGEYAPHGNSVLSIATRGTDRLTAIACAVGRPRALGIYIDYAVSHGAKIINISLGVLEEDDPCSGSVQAVLAAIDRYPDVLFFQATGNDGAMLGDGAHSADKDLAANDRPNFVRVGAADVDSTPLSVTNKHPSLVTIAAESQFLTPSGLAITLSNPPDDFSGSDAYQFGGKTSQASPNAANTAAKMLLLAPTLTPSEIKEILVVTSTPSNAWTGCVLANGVIDHELAMTVAATIGLVRDGNTIEASMQKLGLDGEQQARVQAALAKLTPYTPMVQQ